MTSIRWLRPLCVCGMLALSCSAEDGRLEPEASQAETGGSNGTGGSGATGVASGTPTTGGVATGGASVTGGVSATGNRGPTGGMTPTGGVGPTGGAPPTGGPGTTGGWQTGGVTATGGAGTTGGTTGGAGGNTGGVLTTGGVEATGGLLAAGGISAAGGLVATGGVATTGGADTSGGVESTGGTATCDPTWDPPETANGNTGIPAGLQMVWERSGDVIMAARNIKTRQLMENGGRMRYCARWDSSEPLTATDREQLATLIGKCERQWTDELTGWGCWPLGHVEVEIVLWVVRDAALLQGWSDAEGAYVVSDDPDVPCPQDCAQEPGREPMTTCSAAPYDEFFWLDGDLTDYTGWGSATGFYMGADAILSAARAEADTETIVVHEMGHAHGLDDFYTEDVTPDGWTRFVMKAGSSLEVTETDGWMVRDVWRHIRADYGYPPAE